MGSSLSGLLASCPVQCQPRRNISNPAPIMPQPPPLSMVTVKATAADWATVTHTTVDWVTVTHTTVDWATVTPTTVDWATVTHTTVKRTPVTHTTVDWATGMHMEAERATGINMEAERVSTPASRAAVAAMVAASISSLLFYPKHCKKLCIMCKYSSCLFLT